MPSDWIDNVIIRTTLQLMDGEFKNVHLYLKTPPSDLRQKVTLISTNYPHKEIPERWSTIYKFIIPHEEFKSFNTSGSRTNEIIGKKLVLDIVLDIKFINDPYHLARNIKLEDLTGIWSEKPHVNDYLGHHEFVESDDLEIISLANSLVSKTTFFWTAVQKIADWVNLHIIYDHGLKDQPYQGAVKTLKTRRGICADFVHLFSALSRAVNIPSRTAIGISKENKPGIWESHSWNEVYDPQYGWTPVDTVIQPVLIGSFRNHYIKRTSGYNCVDHLHVFYTEDEKVPAKIRAKQKIFLEDQSIEIPLIAE